MKVLWIFLTLAAISGCGRSPQSLTTAPQAAEVDVSHCPYGFAKAGLCASMTWDEGPSADAESAFTVRFWDAKNSTSTGPYTEPAAAVSAFIQMQCCGSVFFPTVNRIADGVYEVTKVRFLPGRWKVFVQLKDEAGEEKIHEDLDFTR